MAMRKIILSVLVILAFSHVSASAASSSGEFTVLSVGNNSCGSWTQARRSNTAAGFEGWVLGYLTGFNEFSPGGDDITAGTDHAGIFAALDKFCLEKPMETVARASADVLLQLMKKEKAKLDADTQKTINELIGNLSKSRE
jgi:hypothetical protein